MWPSVHTSKELFGKLNLKMFVIELATRLLRKSVQNVCIHDSTVNKVEERSSPPFHSAVAKSIVGQQLV